MSDDAKHNPTPATPTAIPPVDDAWETVSEERAPETKLDFYTIGDSYIGTFLGVRTLDGQNKPYRQYRFEANGEVSFAAGASLDDGMRRVRPGNRVRITFIDEQDTGQPTPMKIFRVEVAKPTRR